VAEMAIAWRSAERHALQCSARAAASEYCWLELCATQCCSSPPRQYQAAHQSERQFGLQEIADVPDGLDVTVACPHH